MADEPDHDVIPANGTAPDAGTDTVTDTTQDTTAGTDTVTNTTQDTTAGTDTVTDITSDTAHDTVADTATAHESIDNKKQNPTSVVVDGAGLVAGRLASSVAKMLLQGRRVWIINCEEIMISGSRRSIIKEYRDFLEISSILNPKHGPYHPRRPDTIIARMIRGMLPRKKPSGKAALGRLRTHIGTPRSTRSLARVELPRARISRSSSSYTTMADLGRTVGWTE